MGASGSAGSEPATAACLCLKARSRRDMFTETGMRIPIILPPPTSPPLISQHIVLPRCGEKEGYFPFTCVEISETPTPRDERPPTPPKLKPAALTSSKRKVKPADVIGARRCSWDGFDSRESNPASEGGGAPESKSKNPSQPSILKSSKSTEHPKKAFPAYDRTASET